MKTSSFKVTLIYFSMIIVVLLVLYIFLEPYISTSVIALTNGNSTQYVSYKVQPGDTLFSIADEFCGNADYIIWIDEVIEINNIENAHRIYQDQRILLPVDVKTYDETLSSVFD